MTLMASSLRSCSCLASAFRSAATSTSRWGLLITFRLAPAIRFWCFRESARMDLAACRVCLWTSRELRRQLRTLVLRPAASVPPLFAAVSSSSAGLCPLRRLVSAFSSRSQSASSCYIER